GLQLVQAAIEALQSLFAARRGVVVRAAAGARPCCDPRFLDVDVATLAPDVFEQHEPCDHVAVASRRRYRDHARRFKRATDAIERLVSQLIREEPIASSEILDEAPAHFEIGLSLRISSVVEPCEEAGECCFGEYVFPVFDVQGERVHAADSGNRRASSGPVCADPSWCRFLLPRRKARLPTLMQVLCTTGRPRAINEMTAGTRARDNELRRIAYARRKAVITSGWNRRGHQGRSSRPLRARLRCWQDGSRRTARRGTAVPVRSS